MEDRLDGKLFTVQSCEPDFVTGVCADGRQVVMGLLCPNLVAFFFDADGVHSGAEQRTWDTPAPTHPHTGRYLLGDDAFQSALDLQISGWQDELGFVPAPVHIHAFVDQEKWVGVELIPEHLLPEQIADEEDPTRREQLHDIAAEWRDSGWFVWWWAKDYWMNAEGEVEST